MLMKYQAIKKAKGKKQKAKGKGDVLSGMISDYVRQLDRFRNSIASDAFLRLCRFDVRRGSASPVQVASSFSERLRLEEWRRSRKMIKKSLTESQRLSAHQSGTAAQT